MKWKCRSQWPRGLRPLACGGIRTHDRSRRATHTHTHTHIYHNIFSLYNVHSYMFRHSCDIHREFQNLYLSTRQTRTQATVTKDCIYSHINTLFSQDIVKSHRLYCTNILYHYTVPLYCTTILYHYTVPLYSTTILYHYTVSLYCTTILYHSATTK